jgi:hypothetical protein
MIELADHAMDSTRAGAGRLDISSSLFYGSANLLRIEGTTIAPVGAEEKPDSSTHTG